MALVISATSDRARLAHGQVRQAHVTTHQDIVARTVFGTPFVGMPEITRTITVEESRYARRVRVSGTGHTLARRGLKQDPDAKWRRGVDYDPSVGQTIVAK